MTTKTTERDLIEEVEELLAKATPGLWRAERTSIGYTIKADDLAGAKNGIGLPAFSIQFAKVWETDPNGEAPLPFEANANLIAAAPELLRRLVEEVKRDRELLRACLSHVLSSAEASRMMDGFEPREHDKDRLAAKVVDAIGDEALRALLFQNPKRRGRS